jgi:hypothetical protein
MLVLSEAAGPHDPAAGVPARAPASVRRTSSIDSSRPEGLHGTVVMDGRARDVGTARGGTAEVLGVASLRATVEAFTRRLTSISTTPEIPALGALLGTVVGPGFRARVDEVAPGLGPSRSLLYLLLDDLPGAALVSGYALQRAGSIPLDADRGALATFDRHDICAGWASDATMMVTLRTLDQMPMPLGPPAPSLDLAADPLAWHEMDPLGPHAMRRRRRLDLVAPTGPGPHRLDAHFRDSHCDQSGAETVLHEYGVRGAVDGGSRRIVELEARANVLPWRECPGAVGSAGRLVGRPLGDLRAWVRAELVGVSTCTHLNDTLRSLSDVEALLAHLEEAAEGRSAPARALGDRRAPPG